MKSSVRDDWCNSWPWGLTSLQIWVPSSLDPISTLLLYCVFAPDMRRWASWSWRAHVDYTMVCSNATENSGCSTNKFYLSFILSCYLACIRTICPYLYHFDLWTAQASKRNIQVRTFSGRYFSVNWLSIVNQDRLEFDNIDGFFQ